VSGFVVAEMTTARCRLLTGGNVDWQDSDSVQIVIDREVLQTVGELFS